METTQHTTKQPMGQQGIPRGNQKYLKINKNGNTTFQNLWNTAKAVLRGKLLVIQAYLKKHENSQINNLSLYLKNLEKEQQSTKLVEGRE